MSGEGYGHLYLCEACIEADSKANCISGFSGYLHNCEFIKGTRELAKSLGCTIEFSEGNHFNKGVQATL